MERNLTDDGLVIFYHWNIQTNLCFIIKYTNTIYLQTRLGLNMLMLCLFSNQMVNSLHDGFKQIFFIFYCKPKTGIAQFCLNKLNFNV